MVEVDFINFPYEISEIMWSEIGCVLGRNIVFVPGQNVGNFPVKISDTFRLKFLRASGHNLGNFQNQPKCFQNQPKSFRNMDETPKSHPPLATGGIEVSRHKLPSVRSMPINNIPHATIVNIHCMGGGTPPLPPHRANLGVFF